MPYLKSVSAHLNVLFPGIIMVLPIGRAIRSGVFSFMRKANSVDRRVTQNTHPHTQIIYKIRSGTGSTQPREDN